jgi:UDP-glucose:(heptosyl)LPS alpha-1,3-glucosyltransferase
MRIGLVCRHYLATKGGLEKYTLRLSEELVRSGHEVTVFCNSGTSPSPGIRIHHVPIFPFTSPGKNLSFALKTSAAIPVYRLDVVQSMERIWTQDIFRASDGINPVQMQEKYPNPLWRAFRAAGPRRRVLSLLERRIFFQGGARWIMTNSELVKAQIMKHYGVPAEKIVVIYNSVDISRFNPSIRTDAGRRIRDQFGIGPQEHLILFMGNDFQRKGLAVLLKALATNNDTSTKLVVAGSDKPGPYQRLARQNGLGEKVHFIGHHLHPEILYGAADLFVLPTRYDAFANVCLEAMACGTPVITTRSNGAAEIIENQKDGYVLDSWDAQELAARIRDALYGGDCRMMGERAARKAATFGMDRYMESLLSLYDQVREAKRT